MKDLFKEYLFNKNVLVCDAEPDPDAFSVLFALANKFNIKVTSGGELARQEMMRLAAKKLGEYVPEAFYRGFPHTVRKLTEEQLIFDQLMNYFVTYGLGDFSDAGHSLYEENFQRIAFQEKDVEVKEFVILKEQEAVLRLAEYVESMLKSSRPLSDRQYEVVKQYIFTYRYRMQSCACKDTLIRLILDTRNLSYARFMALSDVIVLVDRLNYEEYKNDNIRRLNLHNRDRKFISRLIEQIFAKGKCNVRDCFEKKAIWCGLLHHIHFRPTTSKLAAFAEAMRTKGNQSVYAEFERAMQEEGSCVAATVLKQEKGNGALLRHLNYIISRCENEQDVDFVLQSLDAKRPILLIQLLMQYANYSYAGPRTFKFNKYNMMKLHRESAKEMKKRRSGLSEAHIKMLYEFTWTQLMSLLHGKLGKVYIAPEMYDIALPLQENTSNGGYGTLPKGSRLPIPAGKKVRAFTYWEKVDDIDLSVIGVNENGSQREFSWRNMAAQQSEGITFSGDVTSGDEGGAEYFDLDIDMLKELYPDMKYLVFCDNVYSDENFSSCLCKAGFMLRDVEDSGEVYELKTVKSSFVINCDSTFAYLFGIDMEKREFVWLNAAKNSDTHVAGTTDVRFLEEYFKSVEVINAGQLFEMMATELVADPTQADVVVADEHPELAEGVEVIHSYDFEKIAAYLG